MQRIFVILRKKCSSEHQSLLKLDKYLLRNHYKTKIDRVEISLAITVTMKDIDPDFKARLLIECAKLENHQTGRLIDGAVNILKEKFPTIKERTLRRIRADYKALVNLGISSPSLTNNRVGR